MVDHLPDIEAIMKQEGKLIQFHQKWLIDEVKRLRGDAEQAREVSREAFAGIDPAKLLADFDKLYYADGHTKACGVGQVWRGEPCCCTPGKLVIPSGARSVAVLP